MAARLFLSNESGYGYRYDEQFVNVNFAAVAGNITADATVNYIAPAAGSLVDAFLGVNNGVDATNPLFLELEITINGTSVWTTKPKVDKTAGTGRKNTLATATGIVVGVLDTTKVAIAKGDKIQVVFDITRTASPGTEMSDAGGSLTFRYDAGSTP